jgi:hypothetical protein
MGLEEITTEALIREILKRTKGKNIIHVIDDKERSAMSYHGLCADNFREKLKGKEK